MFYLDIKNHPQAFEAESLRKLSDCVAEHYAEQGESICQIEAIYFENDNGARSTLSAKGLDLFVAGCELDNEQSISEAEAEAETMRQNKSDYYSSIL